MLEGLVKLPTSLSQSNPFKWELYYHLSLSPSNSHLSYSNWFTYLLLGPKSTDLPSVYDVFSIVLVSDVCLSFSRWLSFLPECFLLILSTGYSNCFSRLILCYFSPSCSCVGSPPCNASFSVLHALPDKIIDALSFFLPTISAHFSILLLTNIRVDVADQGGIVQPRT